jgi:hypothetical protein
MLLLQVSSLTYYIPSCEVIMLIILEKYILKSSIFLCHRILPAVVVLLINDFYLYKYSKKEYHSEDYYLLIPFKIMDTVINIYTILNKNHVHVLQC